MSRLLLIGLLLCAFVGQNRTIRFCALTNKTAQKTLLMAAHTHSNSPQILSINCNDSLGWGLLDTSDFVNVQSFMETNNEPVTAKYLLKLTNSGDTLAAFRNAYQAILPVPYQLFLPLETTPAFPFPHPNASPFQDSIYPFKIVPSKTDQLALGITTFDLALLSRHVLGIQPITSPYKLLAADINKDGSVDGADILHLRRFILRVDSVFRQSPHWFFIPKTYTMPEEVPSIDSIPQAYYFNPYTSNLPNPFEFIAIKVGDLNNSYHDTTTLISTSTKSRNRVSPLILTTENTRLEKGKTYQLDLKCIKRTKFIALQGTLNLGTEGANAGDFEGIESETLTQFDEENTHKSAKNQIAFSWNAASDKVFEENAALLTLKFKANNDGYLSEILKINDDLAENLVYTEGGDTCKIALQFSEPTKDFYVFQNEPNPFISETSVKIDIKSQNEAAIPAKWSLFDETGNLLAQHAQLFKSGSHLLRLNAQDLGLSKAGFYFLKVETPTGVQTIKLLKM